MSFQEQETTPTPLNEQVAKLNEQVINLAHMLNLKLAEAKLRRVVQDIIPSWE